MKARLNQTRPGQPDPSHPERCRSWVHELADAAMAIVVCAATLLFLLGGIRMAQAALKPPEPPPAAEFYVTFEAAPDALFAEDEDTGTLWIYDDSTGEWDICGTRPLGKGVRVRVHSSGRFRAHGTG